MFTIPKKVQLRLTEALKKYKRIIGNAQKKDVNESDTVTIVVDMFAELFGYDKFSEVTSEYAIRNTYCDLAVKIGSKIRLLIECKAVGVKLKEDHIKQAVDYGINKGVEWIVLTNGADWQIYKILFGKKPVGRELLTSFNINDIQGRSSDDLDKLYILTHEGMTQKKPALSELYDHLSTVNKYMVAQLVLDESTINHIRRLLKKISPDIKVAPENISELLQNEVMKRDILDPENVKDCRRLIKRKLGAQTPRAQSVSTDEKDEHEAEDETSYPIVAADE